MGWRKRAGASKGRGVGGEVGGPGREGRMEPETLITTSFKLHFLIVAYRQAMERLNDCQHPEWSDFDPEN